MLSGPVASTHLDVRDGGLLVPVRPGHTVSEGARRHTCEPRTFEGAEDGENVKREDVGHPDDPSHRPLASQHVLPSLLPCSTSSSLLSHSLYFLWFLLYLLPPPPPAPDQPHRHPPSPTVTTAWPGLARGLESGWGHPGEAWENGSFGK